MDEIKTPRDYSVLLRPGDSPDAWGTSAGIVRSDVSFQREAVVETVRRHRPRLLFIASNVGNEDVLANLAAALEARGEILLVRVQEERPRIVGRRLATEHDDTVSAIQEHHQFTSTQLTGPPYGLEGSTASARLTALWKAGLIGRIQGASPRVAESIGTVHAVHSSLSFSRHDAQLRSCSSRVSSWANRAWVSVRRVVSADSGFELDGDLRLGVAALPVPSVHQATWRCDFPVYSAGEPALPVGPAHLDEERPADRDVGDCARGDGISRRQPLPQQRRVGPSRVGPLGRCVKFRVAASCGCSVHRGDPP